MWLIFKMCVKFIVLKFVFLISYGIIKLFSLYICNFCNIKKDYFFENIIFYLIFLNLRNYIVIIEYYI